MVPGMTNKWDKMLTTIIPNKAQYSGIMFSEPALKGSCLIWVSNCRIEVEILFFTYIGLQLTLKTNFTMICNHMHYMRKSPFYLSQPVFYFKLFLFSYMEKIIKLS